MDGNTDYAVVQTIKGFLGEPKSEHDPLSKKQWQFNCPSPKCRHDVDKFNLEYNSKKHVFKCWKCQYHGFVYTLANDYGSPADFERVKLLLPENKVESLRNQVQNKPKIDHNLVTCKLPEGYHPLGKNRNSKLYNLAWDYLVHERKVSPDLIDKYEIGYTENGPRKLRIIIPSKNAFGRFNYYEARSYVKGPKVIPYIKPPGEEVHKNDIIFNEYFINWDLPVFLVEGVFDMFRLPNAIPVLGKEISELLTDQLLKHNCTVILCFDPDAIEKTVETYTKLSSLGLNVFFVDLVEYNKKYVEENLNHLRGEDRKKELNRDISEIYEERGKGEVTKAVKTLKRLSLSMQINKSLKE
jgi:hypothetical protein